MGIHEHTEIFQGKPVTNYDKNIGIADPINTVYRLWSDYDAEENTLVLLEHFLTDQNARKVTNLIIGTWSYESESNQPLVELLTSSADKLPNLSALFLGDIIEEEAQISWIVQSNLSAMLQAYPQLEYLQVKGNDGLSFGEMKLDCLKTLIIETGGLSLSVAKEVFQAQLPALEHLELWLGTPDYGGDITPEDLAPLFDGSIFLKLSYLGLRDSEIADQVAVAVANTPIVQRLKTLDLSLGNMGDIGATALLESPLINHLEKLDLHHHYISDELTQKLAKLSVIVDVADRQKADVYDGEEHRYIAVSE
jgi:Leucine Rich repeat